MTIPRCHQGGPREKVIQVLLRRKVVLCYDTNRFLNSCMFFEIFRSQNSNFKGKHGEKYCIFRPELPPPSPGAQCRFASETKQMPQQLVSYQGLTAHKV